MYCIMCYAYYGVGNSPQNIISETLALQDESATMNCVSSKRANQTVITTQCREIQPTEAMENSEVMAQIDKIRETVTQKCHMNWQAVPEMKETP